MVVGGSGARNEVCSCFVIRGEIRCKTVLTSWNDKFWRLPHEDDESSLILWPQLYHQVLIVGLQIKLRATQYPGPGPADSTTSPSSFLFVQVHCKIFLVNFILQNSQHVLGSTFTGSSVCPMSVEFMWASEEWLRGIPFVTPTQDCTRYVGPYSVGTGTHRSAEERKNLGERWVNANEHWQSSKNGTWVAWGRLGNFGKALAGFPSSIVRPSAFSSRLFHRPLTTVHRLERSQNAHRAFQQER